MTTSIAKNRQHDFEKQSTNEKFKHEIDLEYDGGNLPGIIPNSDERVKVICLPFTYSPGSTGDWYISINDQPYWFLTNHHANSWGNRRNYAELIRWRDTAVAFPDYFHLSLIDILNDELTASSKREYKLVFRPNLGLAKQIYLETMTIPIKFIQVFYMFLRLDTTKIQLRDSESELMTPNPPRFKIKLYDYQGKTLTWMRQIESGDIKIKYYKDYYYGIPDPDSGESFCYVSSRDVEETAKTLAHYHIYTDPPDFYKEFKINGGLLGDIMGNGKTVTGIAHIYSEHCRLGPSYPPLLKGIEEDVYLPSRATLILCPNNIIEQWYDEFVKCLGTMVIGNMHTGSRAGRIARSDIHSVSDNGKNYRVLKILSMHNLNSLTHADLINADAVIVSYSMMTNTNHIGKGFTKENGFSEQYSEQRLAKTSIPELRDEDPENWTNETYNDLERVLPRKLLYLYKWNRVIHDEFHEVISTKTRTNSLLFIIKSLLKARYYWGFSGSSILENDTILMNLPYLLHFEDDWSEILPMTGVNKTLFFDKCVIKNTKRILPNLKYVKFQVNASSEEQTLYKSMAVYSDVEQQVRFACYHNLNASSGTAANPANIPNAVFQGIVNRLQSADEIMAIQHDLRLKRIDTLNSNLQISQSFSTDLVSHLKNIKVLSDYAFTKNWVNPSDLYFLTDSGHKDHNAKVKAALEIDPNLGRARDFIREYKKEQKNIQKIQEDIAALEEANKLYHNFLQNRTLSCCLCDFSSSDCSQFMALECKDHFCNECCELMCNSGQKVCPKCRATPWDQSKLVNLATQEKAKAEIRSVTGLSKRLWGSKICDVVDQIHRYINEDPTNKIILFAQWEDLLEQYEVALAEVKIEAVTVKGATSMRTKAIRTFQERANCKVILLSSVYGASGINLIEANYVFIVHPFLGDMAEQYEYQAICRAYRTGQVRPVTVVHFIREDTIEKNLYAKREHKDEAGVLNLESQPSSETVSTNTQSDLKQTVPLPKKTPIALKPIKAPLRSTSILTSSIKTKTELPDQGKSQIAVQKLPKIIPKVLLPKMIKSSTNLS